MKLVYIIHGWDGYPENCWFPWLKTELEKRSYKVIIPEMPNPEEPDINSWVDTLKKEVHNPAILIGHSIGCQTILRYLANTNTTCEGVFLVAPFVHLNHIETEEEKEIAAPWLTTQINWKKIQKKAKKFVAFFSDNDPDVDITDAEIFKEKLQAKIIIEHNKGHFDDNAKVTEFSSLLKEIVFDNK